ncbi:MAG: glycosyltransferase [Vicinamibacterales bacterium]|nr:glycosyltransferase [Vicinamibacterales bacterium]
MRCTILAIGSRGDVQPLIALGAGLRASGARVRLATHRDFLDAVTAAGLEFAPIEGQAASFGAGPAGRAFRDRVSNVARFQRFVDSYLALFFTRLLRDAWQASEDADVVLSWTMCAASLAERLRVPVFNAGLAPALYFPTSAFANPVHDAPVGTGPAANRRSWRHGLATIRIGEAQVNAWRTTTLGLAPLSWRPHVRALRRLPHLFGYSPHVLPRPADWPAWAHVTGYWFLDDAPRYTPPRELQAFLDAGPPPIAIGFSSQVGDDAVTLTRTVMEAVTEAGQRAIVVTGFGGLKDVTCPPSVLPVTTVPYDWLLPRVRAMVHQGGAGSTSAAVRAGRPQMAVPFGFDQHLWGARIEALGIGPAPIPAAALTVSGLAAALTTLDRDEAMRARAEALGARVRAEDGIGTAVALVRDAVTRHQAAGR